MWLRLLKTRGIFWLVWLIATSTFFCCRPARHFVGNEAAICNGLDSFVIQHWNYGTPDSVFMGSFYYNNWTAFDSCILKLDTAHFQRMFGYAPSSHDGQLVYSLKGKYKGKVLAVPFSKNGQVRHLYWGISLTEDNVGLKSPDYITSTLADSFKVISEVTIYPKFSINLDSASQKIPYPQMERDNLIEGDVYATFTISASGVVDSIWLTKKISLGIDRAIVRFVKNLPPFSPAKRDGKNVPCTCQLAFHFRVKED